MKRVYERIKKGLLLISVYFGCMTILEDLLIQIYIEQAFSAQKLYYLIFPHSVMGVFALLASIFVIKRICDRPPHRTVIVTSILFSIIMALSGFMNAVHTLSAAWSGLTMMFVTVVSVVGLACICCVLFEWIRAIYIYLLLKIGPKKPVVWAKERIRLFLLFFLLRVPWILVKYPAGIEYDSIVTLDKLFTGNYNSRYQPVGTTWLTGAFCYLGKHIFGSYDVGVFLYVVFLAAISSCVFVYCVHVMRKMKIHRFWTNLSIILFAFSLVLETYMTIVNKDAIYSVALLYTVALWADDMLVAHSKKNVTYMILSALVMTTLRNNGIYILLFCVLYALVGAIRSVQFRRMLIPLVASILGYVFVSNVIYPACGIGKTYAREYMSIPFQQTARYITLHADEVTVEEKAIISSILDYDRIQDVYDPYISDPVKAMYNGDGTDLDAYWSVWKQQLKKHPEVYIDAVYENVYGFVYPEMTMRNGHEISQYISSVDSLSCKEFIVRQPEELDGLRNRGKELIDSLCTLPFVFPFVNTACQVWIMLFMVVYVLVHRKKEEMFLLLPSLVTLLMCIASPTYYYNGTRYALPILMNNILLTSLVFGKSSLSGNSQ